MGKRICHKLGYYVTYWYTGTFHREALYRPLCGDNRGTLGVDRWASGKVDCRKCLKLRRKPRAKVANAEA